MKTNSKLLLLFLFGFLFLLASCEWCGNEDKNEAKMSTVDYTALKSGNDIMVVAQVECNLSNPIFSVDAPFEFVSSKLINSTIYKIVAKKTIDSQVFGEDNSLTIRAKESGENCGLWVTIRINTYSE